MWGFSGLIIINPQHECTRITVVSCVCLSVCYYEINEVVCLEIETKVPTQQKLHALSNNCVEFYENPLFMIYVVIYTYVNL